MTEADYIKATNLAKIRAANAILRTVVGGKVNGIPQYALSKIVRTLANSEIDLNETISKGRK